MHLETVPPAIDALLTVRPPDPAERSSERGRRDEASVLLLGWGGCSERQLEPFAQMHRELGRETRAFICPMLRALLHFEGERRAFRAEAAWLAAAAAKRPVIIHSFSDNGFFSLCMLLSVLRESPEGRRAIANLRGVILDSGPALYAAVGREFSARFASALTPFCLRGLGLPAQQHHDLATPALRACFGLYQACWAGTVRRIVGAYDEVSFDYPRCPHLFLYSNDDPVSPRRDIEAFAEGQKARGVPVETRCFSTDRHLGALRADPRVYRGAVAAFCRNEGAVDLAMTRGVSKQTTGVRSSAKGDCVLGS